MRYKIIDPKCTFYTLIFFVFTWLYFGIEMGGFAETFFAAVLAAAFFWVSYTLVRWVILAIKR